MLRWITNTAIKVAIGTVRGKFLRRYPLVFGALWLYDRYRRRGAGPHQFAR